MENMFRDKNVQYNKDNFLKQTEDARLKRNLEKKRTSSAIKIQSLFKGYLSRKKFAVELENSLNQAVLSIHDLKTSIQLYEMIKKFLIFIKSQYYKKMKNNDHHTLFQNICTCLSNSIIKGDFKHSYVSLIVSKDFYQIFLKQSHRFLQACIFELNIINLKDALQHKTFISLLSILTVFTDHKIWKCYKIENNQLLERTLIESTKSYLKTLRSNELFQKLNKILIQNSLNYNPILRLHVIIQILNLILNVIQSVNFELPIINEFNSFVMTIPFLLNTLQEDKNSKLEMDAGNSNLNILQLTQLKQKIIDANLIARIFSSLSSQEGINEFLKEKDVNHLICFLGNFCSLSKLEFDCLRSNIDIFITISTQIFQYSYEIIYGKPKISKLNSNIDTIRWHPIFGFHKFNTCFGNFESLIIVLDQLRFLWSHQFISILFDTKNVIAENIDKTDFKIFIKSFFDKTLNKKINNFDSIESGSIYRICSFYRQILLFLNEPRIEILSALSIEEEFLLGLWGFVTSFKPMFGLKDLVRILEAKREFTHPIFDVFYLISSLILYLVTVQDENEFYIIQPILKLDDYKNFCTFLNNFIYKIISCELIDLKMLDQNSFYSTFHQLLITLYIKDSRRPFIENMPDFWTIKEIKIKSLLNDLEKDTNSSVFLLQNIPHTIPLKYRIEILQSKIEKDKPVLYDSLNGAELPQIRINIRRNRLIEDAYSHLANLPSNVLKGIIRISFVNDFGLREAGIDQDGVFKEFLQNVIKQIVDLKFNLFQVTSDQQLYPSPSSYFVEDHLEMFKFVGKLLGKLIYENQVVDVEFASFFLRQIAGYRYQNYSFLDDLATLDRDLYKNLNLIKHEDNVSDLELVFTHSEYHLGKLISHELVPSGDFIKVTNENKIKYIHLLAHFKLHKQIKDQVNAFNEGFKSIIKQEWLNMFSVSEIQLLISGSLQDINFDDLKKNVQYWGGLHSNHRLVKWLWDVLENDFTREERSLFLKFVTSSPKAPLLGFSSLIPPFSIRCVEGDEQDGVVYDSSLRGFFKTVMNIGSADTSRLPTSSTCFNLLKLPNYSKKSTLKDKLRYAIKSNSGFELS